MVSFFVACEGDVDALAAKKILSHVGATVHSVHVQSGKGVLDQKIGKYMEAAKIYPWFVLRDMDRDAACAPALVSKLMNGRVPTSYFALRVAVRSLEGWLCADRSSFCLYFGVPKAQLNVNPDDIARPKRFIVDRVRSSRKAKIRQMVLPEGFSRSEVGTAFDSALIEYIQNHWSVSSAAVNSSSLGSTLRRLEDIVYRHKIISDIS